MSDAAIAKFGCDSCGRTYSWKQEIAGKRVKCKCGSVMTVPRELAPPEPQLDDLYDLAPSEEESQRAHAAAPVVMPVAATAGASVAGQPVRKPKAPKQGAAGVLPYQRGQTAREKELTSSATLLDKKRDLWVPLALIIIGLGFYIFHYAVKYKLGGTGIAVTGVLLTGVALFKASLLMGFAFVTAGPLGVSYGGILTAALKFCAIAVFGDATMTWLEFAADKLLGVDGIMASCITFPFSLGLYWILLIKLFDMDAGDSWMVVSILYVFDMVIRFVLGMVLLAMVLKMGGAALPMGGPTGLPAIGGGGGVSANPTVAEEDAEMEAHIEELRDHQCLKEAREFIAGGRQGVLGKPTEDWYAAGCPNVWFEVERDINGRMDPQGVIVELPADKEKRKQCYEILKAYYKNAGFGDDTDDKDTGHKYLEVMIQ